MLPFCHINFLNSGALEMLYHFLRDLKNCGIYHVHGMLLKKYVVTFTLLPDEIISRPEWFSAPRTVFARFLSHGKTFGTCQSENSGRILSSDFSTRRNFFFFLFLFLGHVEDET